MKVEFEWFAEMRNKLSPDLLSKMLKLRCTYLSSPTSITSSDNNTVPRI